MQKLCQKSVLLGRGALVGKRPVWPVRLPDWTAVLIQCRRHPLVVLSAPLRAHAQLGNPHWTLSSPLLSAPQLCPACQASPLPIHTRCLLTALQLEELKLGDPPPGAGGRSAPTSAARASLPQEGRGGVGAAQGEASCCPPPACSVSTVGPASSLCPSYIAVHTDQHAHAYTHTDDQARMRS